MKKNIFLLFIISTICLFSCKQNENSNASQIINYEKRTIGETSITYGVPIVPMLYIEDVTPYNQKSKKIEVSDAQFTDEFFDRYNHDGQNEIYYKNVINNYIDSKKLIDIFTNTTEKYFFIDDEYSPYLIQKSYKRMTYNDKIIGEEYFTINDYEKYNEFYSVHLSYRWIYIIEHNEISMSVSYYDMYDKSIINTYPELFILYDEKYKWRDENSRQILYDHLINDDIETLPENMKQFRLIVESINASLDIPEYD